MAKAIGAMAIWSWEQLETALTNVGTPTSDPLYQYLLEGLKEAGVMGEPDEFLRELLSTAILLAARAQDTDRRLAACSPRPSLSLC